MSARFLWMAKPEPKGLALKASTDVWMAFAFDEIENKSPFPKEHVFVMSLWDASGVLEARDLERSPLFALSDVTASRMVCVGGLSAQPKMMYVLELDPEQEMKLLADPAGLHELKKHIDAGNVLPFHMALAAGAATVAQFQKFGRGEEGTPDPLPF